MSRLRRALDRVCPPPLRKRIYVTVYALVALGGVWILLEPPRSIENFWGLAQTYVWGGLLLVGGVLCALAARAGRWKIERISQILLWTFLVLYGIFLLYMHFTSEGSRSAGTAALVLGAGFLAIRLEEIWGWDYEPRPADVRG